MVKQVAAEYRPVGNPESVASAWTTSTLVPAIRWASWAARSSSSSTAVRRGTKRRRTSVVKPGPGPISSTSSPRSRSRSAHGIRSPSTYCAHSGLAHRRRWISFTAGASERSEVAAPLAGGVAPAILDGRLIQPLLDVGVERRVERSQAVGQLVGPAGADDRGGDGRMGQHPRHGHGRHRRAGVAGQLAELIDRVELAVVPVAILIGRGRGAEREPRTLVGRGRTVVLPGQQPAGQRVVRDYADAFLLAQRQQLALDLAEQEVVAGLHRIEPHQRSRLATADGASDLV